MSGTKSSATKTRRISPIIWIVAIWGIAIIVGIALRLGWMPAIDMPLLSWIQDNQVDWLQQVMYVITLVGYWPAYIVVLVS